MPNGRSGEFSIQKEKLEHILNALPSEAVIGTSIVSDDLDVSAVSRMVIECPDDLIWVEEQDDRWYIIHLEPIQANPPNPETWVAVSPESPLFEEMRRQLVRHGK